MILISRARLRPVQNTKRLPPQVLAAFAAVFERWIRDAHDDNQTHAAADLGITQSHISAMLQGLRGPGLNTLILLRKKTGVSIDEMLGLPSLKGETYPDPATLTRGEIVRILDAELEARGLPVPKPEPVALALGPAVPRSTKRR